MAHLEWLVRKSVLNDRDGFKVLVSFFFFLLATSYVSKLKYIDTCHIFRQQESLSVCATRANMESSV